MDDARGLISARIQVQEVVPVLVSEVDVQVIGERTDQNPPPLPKELPIKQGAVFRETDYQQAEQVLRSFFLEHGYAHVKTERKAEVDPDARRARVSYTIQSGPVTVFGTTTVKGTDKVDPELITRELAYKTSETFSQSKVAATREKLLALDLFGAVRVTPVETQGAPTVVPMEVEVSEKSYREIKLGLGYGTEDHFRT